MKVKRIIIEEIELRELKRKFVHVSTWLETHGHKQSYTSCYFCGKSLRDLPDNSFMGLTLTNKGNKQICQNCSDDFIVQNKLENGDLKIF